MELDPMLAHLVSSGGSDLHVHAGAAPHVRVNGNLRPAPFPEIGAVDTEQMAYAVMSPERAEEFQKTNEADCAYTVAGLGRFRVNVLRQRGTVGMVVRRVAEEIPGFEALGLPPTLARLAEEPRGLVLVTGPTGSGKTTTIAAMIDHINRQTASHIVTIEDPIEVLHQDRRSIVDQREVGIDTDGFGPAMRRVLRQDPDVIFVGEMRDTETVWAALSAAETGHLVLSTLHTLDASETVNRIVDLFPPHQQHQARLTLASTLRGVVSQRLLPRADRPGRVPAVEVLIATGRVAERILEPSLGTLDEVMVDGAYYGMQTFDQSLAALYESGHITVADALASATSPHDLRLSLQRAGLLAAS